MALIERIMGLEEPKLPVHQLRAGVSEVLRGKATREQLVTYFGLSANEADELETLVLSGQSGEEIEDVLLLAEQQLGYDTADKVRTRLGL